MTHQNHQTNGASLEDCHTNFYALTDLCGIKWRKLVVNERPNATSDPLDDPVLRSYSRCLAADILCVWRRVASVKNEPSGGLFDIASSGFIVHPSLSLTAAKELWIFWHGEEPDLSDLVVPELLKCNEGLNDHGSWESGLSYECRSLLFKALHNLIERNLLSRDVVRLGRWFVQPCSSSERVFGKSSHHLSFSFAFFVHGDSTVCASIDLREHPAVRRLSMEYLAEAIQQVSQQQQQQQNATQNGQTQTPLPSPASGVNGGNARSGNSSDALPKPKRVILAPFGLSATLTGHVYRHGSMDAVTQKAFDDWCAFYPLTMNKDIALDGSSLPPMVEVISGGVKLRYPSKYVLVTDIDDNNNDCIEDKNALTSTPMVSPNSSVPITQFIKGGTNSGFKEPTPPVVISSSVEASKCMSDFPQNQNDLGNPVSMHLRPSMATVLPERVWQDCVLNPLDVSSTAATTTSSTSGTVTVPSPSQIKQEPPDPPSRMTPVPFSSANSDSISTNNSLSANNSNPNSGFNFIDPTQKSPCSCTKLKRVSGRGGSSSSSSAAATFANLTSSSSSATAAATALLNTFSSSNNNLSSNNNSGGGSKSSSSRTEKGSSRAPRIPPFHKRNCALLLQSSSYSNSSSSRGNKSSHGRGGGGGGVGGNANSSKSKASSAVSASKHQTSRGNSSSSGTTNNNNSSSHHHSHHHNHHHSSTSTSLTSSCSTSTTTSTTSSNSSHLQSSSSPLLSIVPTALSYKSRQATATTLRALNHPSYGSMTGRSANQTMNESLAQMTSCVNSPGSAEPSPPHPNTTGLSQQSVPSELLPILSPHIENQPIGMVTGSTNNAMEQLLNSENSSSNIISETKASSLSPFPQQQQQKQQQQVESGSKQASNSGNDHQSGHTPNTVVKKEPTSASYTSKSSSGSTSGANLSVNSGINSKSNLIKKNYSGVNLNSNVSSGIHNVNSSNIVSLKRPSLISKDYENIIDDDLEPQQLLYDYTMWDAWLNHPVKRYRPNEDSSTSNKLGLTGHDLYVGHHKQLQQHHKEQQQKLLLLSLSSSPSLLSSGAVPSAGIGPQSAAVNSSNLTNAEGKTENFNNSSNLGSGTRGIDGDFEMMSPTDMDFQMESPLLQGNEIKKEAGEGGEEDGGANKDNNLFTCKGLQPSYEDLDRLFNECNDNSNYDMVNTPPGSNKSVSGNDGDSVTTTSIKRGSNMSSTNSSVGSNCVNNTSSLGSINSASSVEILTKMFPTPPSLEHHPNSSPCGGALSDGGGQMSDIEMKVVIKQEVQYPNLGSPAEEPFEDWSYVFVSPKVCTFVGSTKYAPLTDLPSQSLPPVIMPINSVYKPSWEQHKQLQLHHHHQQPPPPPPSQQQQRLVPANNGSNKENVNNNATLKGMLSIKQEPQMQSAPSTPSNPMLTAQLSRPSPSLSIPMGPNSLNSNLSMSNFGGVGPQMMSNQMHLPMRGMSPMQQFPQSPLQQHPFRRTPNQPPPPYELAVASPANQQAANFMQMSNNGNMDGGGGMMHMQMQRGPPNMMMMGGGGGNMMMNQQQQNNMMNFQNSNMMNQNNGFGGGGGMMGGNMMTGNGMMNNNAGGPVCGNNVQGVMGSGGGMNSIMNNTNNSLANVNSNGAHSSTSDSLSLQLPEADSLLVNILLYDTLLNIFRDHNFDSCTICVCNASKKCVGNIRGSESGVYLALPGSSFATMTAALTNKGQLTNHSANNFSGAFGGMESPSGSRMNHQNGYLDEDPIKCQCGFSAVVNRRLAHRSGLFYEDEMEITGMAEDPTTFKKRSLLKYVIEELQGRGGVRSDSNNNVSEKGLMIKQEPFSSRSGTPMVSNSPQNSNMESNSNNMLMEANTCDSSNNDVSLPLVIMDLLREQCATVVQSSANSIIRAIRKFKSVVTTQNATNPTLNILDFTDAQDVVSLALEQARIAFENAGNSMVCKMEYDSFGNQIQNQQMMRINNGPMSSNSMMGGHNGGGSHNQIVPASGQKSVSAHRWPYVKAKGPRSNQDIIRLMKSMQPLLQDAFHKKCTTRLWDAPYTVQGPLTWRQFHRLASSSTTGQCEPQPIPSVIVGHEKDWLSVAPYALHYWDKLLLEPYSYSRDIVYLVIAPDNDFVVAKTKSYFKELSTTFEMCKLGRHTPIKGWDGVFRVGKSMKHINGVTNDASVNSTVPVVDEWFSMLGDHKVSESLKMYANACQSYLVPYLSKVPTDKSLLDPPEGHYQYQSGSYGSSSATGVSMLNRSLPSPMPPPHTPEPNTQADRAPSTPKSSEGDGEGQNSLNLSGSNQTTPAESLSPYSDSDVNPPCIVVYIVEPFTCGNDSSDLQRLACLALLRCYSNVLSSVPESVRSNITFQIISQESILELGQTRNQLRISDEMRCLALSVFSQCRRFLTHASTAKSLTGFGTAANMEIFLKNKDENNRAPYKLYNPPYILSAQHEKSEKAEAFGTASAEQQCSIMYCSYCLSEDQNWLLAVATDERGELLETITINIDIPNRVRRKKASARRLGLQKLMDFILGVISQSIQPWRLVVGRIGRIGHGELKGWSWLLSKQNLLKASKQLREICKQCSLMYPNAVPSILSACLITLEPDSNLRVMPDQFTPDERFSQISMQNPLATPQDVTSTHILVFPTSAKTQSSQTAFQETHINGIDGIDDEFLPHIDDDEEIGESVNGLNDLFTDCDWDNDQMMQAASPDRRQGSPGVDDIPSSIRHSPGPSGSNSGQKSAQDNEEVGQLLQQPLALGYLVSTAPTGRMPDWFWSSCPHMENVCPVFLKTALHLHSPSIQQNTDDLLQQNNSSPTDHPLDSQFTADVLRYVLEGYNVLSWLAMDSNTHDRLSCLPIHVQMLMQLYHMSAALA